MDKIQASLVLEILGRPAEHVKEALIGVVKTIGEEKGINITKKEFNDPIPAQNSKNLFTTFVNLDVDLDTLDNYFGLLFTYMPSHIELINPEKITYTNAQINELGNAIVQRLHHYDSITKRAMIDKETYEKKLKEVAPHLFKKVTKKEAEEIENKKNNF